MRLSFAKSKTIWIRLGILLLVFFAWAFSARFYYLCHILGDCEREERRLDSLQLSDLPLTLELQAEDTVLLRGYPEFYSDFAGAGLVLFDEHRQFLKALAGYLGEYPAGRVQITGAYSKAEEEQLSRKGIYQSLGQARAAAVAKELTANYRVNPEQLVLRDSLVEGKRPERPLSFFFLGYRPQAALRAREDTLFLQQVQRSIQNITYTDISAQFDSGSERFQPGDNFQVYVDSLKSYFVRNPKDYLLITGHTDSKGDKNFNQRLGLSRANATARYLREQGIEARIETRSEGLSRPLVPDRNADGEFIPEAMARNRRVQLEIKKGGR